MHRASPPCEHGLYKTKEALALDASSKIDGIDLAMKTVLEEAERASLCQRLLLVRRYRFLALPTTQCVHFLHLDTGISGRTAQKVSEKMAVIGQHHQVLCITHLPQIAAMADSHFEIEKHLQGTETITQIHVLKEHDSIRELARLLGGAEITPAVLENAKEMKELAQKQKNTRFK